MFKKLTSAPTQLYSKCPWYPKLPHKQPQAVASWEWNYSPFKVYLEWLSVNSLLQVFIGSYIKIERKVIFVNVKPKAKQSYEKSCNNCTTNYTQLPKPCLIHWTANLWRWSKKTSKLTSSVNMMSPPGIWASELYVAEGFNFARRKRACEGITC